MIGGKIFSTKGALWNLLLGLKDELECALDASSDATKADAINESLDLFSFYLDFLAFTDAEVSKFSDEGWVSEVYSSSVTFCGCLSSWCFLKEYFLKEENAFIRRYFDFRL